MKKYSYMNVVAFKDKKTGTVIITREYKNDDEYFEIMDSIDGNAWEMIFDKITMPFHCGTSLFNKLCWNNWTTTYYGYKSLAE